MVGWIHCNGNLPPYFGTPIPGTTPSTKSLCAIYANNVDFLLIGLAAATQNTINNMVMGIVSYGSNMEVTNTQIKNISRSSTYQSYNGRSLYFANGSGIYSQGNGAYTINIRGNGLQFQKCFTGVTIQDQDFLIQNCIMTDMTAGIQINSCINRVGMINQNYIESTDRGINLWLNDNARTISIIDNEIYAGFNLTTTKHPGAIGIGIREGHHSASMFTHVTMLLNTIYVDHGLFGILMQSADHITANGNQVFLRFDNILSRMSETVRFIFPCKIS